MTPKLVEGNERMQLTSQRGWFLKTGAKSLALVTDSYVVTRTWNFAFVWPCRGIS
jgi:hypothetical protein